MTRMERRRIRRRRARIRLATVAAVALAVVGCGAFTMAGLTVEVTEASGPEVEKLVFQTVMDEGPEAAAEDQAVYEEDPLEAEKIEQALVEQGYFRDDVPLSYEDQDFLHTACNESGVPYALALAVIQKETGFRNVLGDDGASAGYMQVQERWHRDRMERLGVKGRVSTAGMSWRTTGHGRSWSAMMSAVSRAEQRLGIRVPEDLAEEAVALTKRKMEVKGFPPEYEELLLEDEIVEACLRCAINRRYCECA